MNDESIDTYQVTVSCRATNEAAIKRVFKILSGFGEAWKPGLLFMTSSLSDKNKTSPYKLGEIASFVNLSAIRRLIVLPEYTLHTWE